MATEEGDRWRNRKAWCEEPWGPPFVWKMGESEMSDCASLMNKWQNLGSKSGLLLLTVGKEERSNEKSHKPISLGQLNSLSPTLFAFHLDPCFPADTARRLRSVVELECMDLSSLVEHACSTFAEGLVRFFLPPRISVHCWENLGLMSPALRMVSLRLLVPSIYTAGSFAFGCKEEMPQ